MRFEKIREGLRFLHVLTPGRAFNYWLLQWSGALSRLTKSPVLFGNPAFLHIEPTNLCNLQCPECPTGAGLITRPKGQILLNDYQNMLGKVASKACYLTLYFQGEPLLHKDFAAMVRSARLQRLFVVTSTNAQLLTESLAEQIVKSGLDRIIVSFDGPDELTYATYRKGGIWKNVVQAVEYLRKARENFRLSTPVIVLQCLVIKANEQKLEAVRTLANSLGADVVEFKTIQLLERSRPSELLPSDSRFSRYAWKEGQGYIMKRPSNRACSRIFNSCVITWDGRVVPCCYDKDADFSFGNLHTQTFQEIWKGKERKDFVRRVIRQRGSIGMCGNCGER